MPDGRLPIAPLLLALALSGCATLDARRWVEGPPIGEIGLPGYRSAPFRPALQGCVAAHDAEHLFELRDGGDYEASEMLENAEAVRAVKACMREKGWQNIPAVILGP